MVVWHTLEDLLDDVEFAEAIDAALLTAERVVAGFVTAFHVLHVA